MIVEFSEAVDILDWAGFDLEVFAGGSWQAGAVSNQFAPTFLEFNGGSGFSIALPGDDWRMTAGPPGFVAPQTGTVS